MENEKIKEGKGKKLLINVLKVVLSILAVYLITQKVELREVGVQFSKMKFSFALLAVISFFISKVISAVRLNAYYKTQDILLPESSNTKLYFNSMFYNLFIPLVGGEAYKVMWLRKNYNADYKSLIWSALLDRGSGLVALIVLTVVYFNLYDNGYDWSAMSWPIIPITLIGSFLVHHLFFKSWKPAFTKTTVLSILVQVLQVVTIFFLTKAIGLDVKITEYIFIFLVSSFAYILPFIGARELAFVYGAEYLGLDNEISLTLSLLFYLVIAFNSLLGAVFFFIPIQKQN